MFIKADGIERVRLYMEAIYDVIIDLRPDSETYCQWLAVLLTANCSLRTIQ